MYVAMLKKIGKAVLRVSKRDISDSIAFEVNLLDFLFHQNISVPHIIPTKEGALWIKHDGLPVVCFHFIPGEALLVDVNNKPQSVYAFTAGKSLGLLHAAGRQFNYRHAKRRTIFTEYNRALHQREKILLLESGKEFLKTIERYLNWAQEYNGTTGIIHNDYIPSNVMFNGKESATIIDFDWACRGPLIKDVGIALATWSLPDGLEHHWKDVFNAFIEGYNETAPEKIMANEILYKWICFACLTDACTFFSDLPEDDPSITRIMQCRRYRKFLYFAKKT
ncbi:hypothetical protein COU89_03695 [Candidatus Roizmanbacteria bacterium CG10_big_fil_rev_8_21_14_0_10_45_7]|uniref:Aminoglycoside phosphotransferase domain-containing protein n=1 Tax=Candidatus Roizmanbacteria bacterium CG10_big_fil_rev_8_21_14_0_10_45_7 TaxID=1974854 RepID=A0A2M8KU00_9BACT|nr:MAG: hypothetical protein COU89_03695 [Candidatus Roizmanbacteria bacterium CG10_big_fil_rev_8_21_14_0_10_45_7]